MSELIQVKKQVMCADNTNQIIELAKDRFNSIACENIDFDREMHFLMQLLEKNTYLAGIALKKKQSFYNAIVNIASLGLTLCPSAALCYLIPRGGDVCLDLSYMGMLEIVESAGAIKGIKAEVVRANDIFERPAKFGDMPVHRYGAFDTIEQRGEILGAYAVALKENGSYYYETMSLEQIYLDHRSKSESYKSFKAGKVKSCVWISDEIEMIKKTLIRRIVKMLPKNGNKRMAAMIETLDKDIDLSQNGDIETVVISKDDLLLELGELLSKIENGHQRLNKWLLTAHKIECDEFDQLDIEMLKRAIAVMKKAI